MKSQKKTIAQADELWGVRLARGEVMMTLDQLDHAFDVGSIDERTLVRRPGTAVWLTLAIAAVLHTVLHTLPELDGRPLRAMALGTLAGLTLAGALLCFEVFTDQALRRLLIPVIPALLPNPLHVELDGGQVVSLRDHLPNPSICVLALLFWPAVLIAIRLDPMRRHRYGVLLAAGVAGVTVFASEHASSMVAFAGAGLTFALFQACPRVARPLIVTGWATATLLAVPIAYLPYSAGMHRASWLPDSARHRVVIWRHTSEQVANAPVLGAGASTDTVAWAVLILAPQRAVRVYVVVLAGLTAVLPGVATPPMF